MMTGMKLIIVLTSAKNLSRARDLDFLAANGGTAHSGLKVNKTQYIRSRRLAGNGSNFFGDMDFRHVVF